MEHFKLRKDQLYSAVTLPNKLQVEGQMLPTRVYSPQLKDASPASIQGMPEPTPAIPRLGMVTHMLSINLYFIQIRMALKSESAGPMVSALTRKPI